MEADPGRLIHRNAFNVTSMSLEPEMLYAAIRQRIPEFRMEYAVSELKQSIAESWPNVLDDSCARNEWDWNPKFDLEKMTDDMIRVLRQKKSKVNE